MQLRIKVPTKRSIKDSKRISCSASEAHLLLCRENASRKRLTEGWISSKNQHNPPNLHNQNNSHNSKAKLTSPTINTSPPSSHILHNVRNSQNEWTSLNSKDQHNSRKAYHN